MRKLMLFLFLLLALAACSSGELSVAFSNLPEGDATRGAELFNQETGDVPGCFSCHRTDNVHGRGPGLAGFGVHHLQLHELVAEDQPLAVR